jgi:LCP family protein required for cell wall assembly
MLVLGSDAKYNRVGERIDTIMVATINPVTGRIALASLPRDTVNVPISPREDYGTRINALLTELQSRTGNRREALRRMVRAMSHAFGIEIDYYVLVGFGDLERLITSIGGVDVVLDRPLVDTTIHRPRGLVLKRGRNHLNGRRALSFARTRHADSDYERGRRQQQLLVAIAAKVVRRGIDALPALARLADQKLETNLPFSAAPALLALARQARLDRYRSVVLAPNVYAHEGPDPFTTELDIVVVRRMFAKLFGPVGQAG